MASEKNPAARVDLHAGPSIMAAIHQRKEPNAVPQLTILFGVIFIVLGLIGFFGWEQLGAQKQSVTALIPAFFGVPIAILGAVSLMKPAARKHAMHAAVMLGLLGFLGTIGGLIKALKWMAGTAPERPAAVAIQAIMAVLCAIFIALCVRSFIAARKARTQGIEGQSSP